MSEEYGLRISITPEGAAVSYKAPRQEINIEESMLSQFPHLRDQWDEFDTLSPHLFPVVVGALIDAKITDMLASLFVEGKPKGMAAKSVKSLLGAEGLRYVDKVRLTIATGLLPEEVGDCLFQVGYIRNHFAHVPRPSLLDEKIKEYVVKLSRELIKVVLDDWFKDDPKGLNKALDDMKAHVEENTEEAGYSSLKSSWLILSILIESAGSRLKRLEPLLTRSGE